MDCVKTKKRDAYLDGLYDTWELASTREDPYLNSVSLDTFGIKCHNLLQELSFDEAAITPRFFRRMPHGKLQEYPVDMGHKKTMDNVNREKALWNKSEKAFRELDPVDLAAMMCSAMRFAFDTHKRKAGDGQQVTLRQMTEWNKADFGLGMFHDVFDDDDDVRHSKYWWPKYAWQSGKPKAQPHVMFTLAHEYEGNDNSLLRGEVLAIVATMLTRLERNSFKHHNIIPVMVLSCMGAMKGRVLQAYFADDGLVIYKSRLFSFDGVRDGKLSAEFFLKYLGSDMIGNTAVIKTLSTVKQLDLDES